MSYDPSGLHVVGGGDEDKRWWRTRMISLSLSLELFLLSSLFLPFRLMNGEKIFFFRTTNEKFGFSIVTTTGFLCRYLLPTNQKSPILDPLKLETWNLKLKRNQKSETGRSKKSYGRKKKEKRERDFNVNVNHVSVKVRVISFNERIQLSKFYWQSMKWSTIDKIEDLDSI